MAPIDLSYIERVILKLARFVGKMTLCCHHDAHLGSPMLDLQMRIQEIVGEVDANLKQAAPMHQLALQVSIGDVRIMLPCRRGISFDRRTASGHRAFRRLRHIRRSGRKYHLNSRQPFLVVVLSGFSMSTEMDEWEESMQNTISLTDALSAREQMIVKEESCEISDVGSPRASSISAMSAEDMAEDLAMKTNRINSRRLSMQFSVQAFLGDPFSPGEMTFHRQVQLLKQMTIQAICNSCVQSNLLEETNHTIKVTNARISLFSVNPCGTDPVAYVGIGMLFLGPVAL